MPAVTTRGVLTALVVFAVASVSLWGTTGTVGADDSSDTVDFSVDGTYTVPEGVTSLWFTVTGAGGGSSSTGQTADEAEPVPGPNPDASSTVGGNGGVASGLLSVTPGETLTIVVGGAAGNGSSSADGPDRGGFGGS
ncbi:MAG TPA: hypothetical protein VFN21_02885, partial [Acidimicrobiales bacterium]|nr:hypothetical protein [Acidimicrobiales bacterium]